MKLEMIYNAADNFEKNLLRECNRMQKIVDNSPNGMIHVYGKNKNAIQYMHYYKENGQAKRRHLSKTKDAKLIKQLSDKKFTIEEIKNIKLLLKMNKKNFEVPTPKVGIQLADDLEKRHIFTTAKTQLSADSKVCVWENESYVSLKDIDTSLPEPNHRTASGICVRSKSEGTIADILHMLHIPFRYEAQLDLGEYGIIYPDFTLYNPYTDHECIYEHFGMMDDHAYEKRANEKINKLILSGMQYGRDFIFTFESRELPLTSDVVWSLLKPYQFRITNATHANMFFARQ